MPGANPRMSFLKDGYISPFGVFDVETLSPFPYRKAVRKVICGAVYNAGGALEPFSERPGGKGGDRVCSVNGAFRFGAVPEAEEIKGRSVFLGPLHHHYGHFITEGLSRLWFADFMGDFDNYIYVPFLGEDAKVNRFHRHFFELLGMDPARIKIVSKGARCENLHVPKQLWNVNSGCNDFMSGVYRRIAERSRGRVEGARYFLTRKQDRFNRIGNVEAVNKLFEDRGFSVLCPEDLSLECQLRIYSSRAPLAGFPGTALHNVLFSTGGKKILEVGDTRNPRAFHRMQVECNRVSGAVAERIDFVGEETDIDLGYLARKLDDMRAFWEEAA